MPSSPRRALLYGGLLLHTVLSAGSYLCGKSTLREIPPIPLGLLRFIGASALLLILLRRVRPPGQRLPPRSAWPRLLLLAFVVGPISQGFFLGGLALSTAAHAALLYTLTPLFVLLLAQVLLRELPGVRTAAGTLIALAGALYVLAWRGLAYLILVTSVIAYLIWYWALAHLPAARVAIFSNLQPLATAVLAHLFLGEHVTPQFVGGALVVISGVILAQLRAPRTAAEVPPEPA